MASEEIPPVWEASGLRGERCVRVSVPREERGRHTIAFAEPRGVRAPRRYVLAAKSGPDFPSIGAQDFHWAASFSADHDERPENATAVVAIIESGTWEFESSEVFITYGFLDDDEPAPRRPPEAGELGGVAFEQRARGEAACGGGGDTARFEPERLELSGEAHEAYKVYYRAFADVDGQEISYQAVQKIPQPSLALTYGEAHFLPTFRLLRLLGAGPGDVLVDLGSGTGRLVLAAALGFPELGCCWGVEVVPGLHEAAAQVHARVCEQESCRCAPVKLTLGDFRTEDWSQATLVVAMSLCFPEDLLVALERQALALRPGTRIVVMHCCFGEMLRSSQQGGDAAGVDPETAFRPIQLRDAHPRHAVPVEMSFGETPLYVFERAPEGPAPPPPFELGALD